MARMIIADDHEMAGEIPCGAPIGARHGATLVTNGADALAIIKARQPDVNILDCNMPEVSGVLLVQELCKSPVRANLPVMMLTGRPSDRDGELARFAGATDHTNIPVDPDELVFRVEELFAGKR
jgi:DNA-binding response OmpR family regulator